MNSSTLGWSSISNLKDGKMLHWKLWEHYYWWWHSCIYARNPSWSIPIQYASIKVKRRATRLTTQPLLVRWRSASLLLSPNEIGNWIWNGRFLSYTLLEVYYVKPYCRIGFNLLQLIVAAVVAVAFAAPTETDAPVAIVSSKSEVNADGSYSYAWVYRLAVISSWVMSRRYHIKRFFP